MSQVVGYFQAWSLWGRGDPDLREMSLWGLEILWWGRLGKVALFAAGFTLVLDIVGLERFRKLSGRYATWLNKPRDRVAGAVGGITALIGFFVALIFSGQFKFLEGLAVALFLVVAYFIAGQARKLFVRVFEREKLAHAVRIIALLLFIAGFHFDLLAS